jgi:hypothetical protein
VAVSLAQVAVAAPERSRTAYRALDGEGVRRVRDGLAREGLHGVALIDYDGASLTWVRPAGGGGTYPVLEVLDRQGSRVGVEVPLLGS